MANERKARKHPPRRPPRPTLPPSELASKPILTLPEVVTLTSLPTTTLYQHTKQGNGPPWFFIGRKRYVRTPDLLAWIDKHTSNRSPQIPPGTR